MEHRELSEDQKALVATAIRHPTDFAVRDQYLADCHRLHERGWLDRELTDEIYWTLSAAGHTALAIGIPLAEAREALN